MMRSGDKKQLTPLQRDVIQRLREAGFEGLADVAFDYWSRRESIPRLLPIEVMRGRTIRYRDLLDDMDRANGEASG